MKTQVSISEKNLNTKYRQEKALLAAKKVFSIANSNFYENAMLNMPEKYRTNEVGHLKHVSNEELYKLFKSGKEEWNDEVDNEIDLIVDDFYKKFFGPVAYMIPGKPTIWVNTKFFDTMPVNDVVANFIHEYWHTLGARHGGKNYKQSIAWYQNKIVKEYFSQNDTNDTEKIEMKKVCWRSWKTLWLRKYCKWVAI